MSSVSFLLKLNNVLLYVHNTFCLSINSSMGWFHLSAIVNSAALNFGVQLCLISYFPLFQPVWKTFWQFFKTLNIELPYDLAIPFLDMYLNYFTYLPAIHTASKSFLILTNTCYFLALFLFFDSRCPKKCETVSYCGFEKVSGRWHLNWDLTGDSAWLEESDLAEGRL